jgi:hypothetical protein
VSCAWSWFLCPGFLSCFSCCRSIRFRSFLQFVFPFRKSRRATIFPAYFHRSAAGFRSPSRLHSAVAPSCCLGCVHDFLGRVSGLQSSRSHQFCFIRSPAQGFSPVIDLLPLPLISFHRPDFIPSLLDSAANGVSIKDSILSLVLVALTSAVSRSPFLCCHRKLFDFGCRSSILHVLYFGLLQVRTGIVLELLD